MVNWSRSRRSVEKCAVGGGVVAHLELDLAEQRDVRRYAGVERVGPLRDGERLVEFVPREQRGGEQAERLPIVRRAYAPATIAPAFRRADSR